MMGKESRAIEEGHPDFRYVATHICDSVKRRLKVEGVSGLQGEFGIGLLSFWTLGEELTLTSTADDDRAWQMVMRKGDPGFAVKAKRTLFAEPGTHLRINRLLEGIRSLSGEKIQWYLAAELRDRIRHSGYALQLSIRLHESSLQSNHDNTRADCCTNCLLFGRRQVMFTLSSI
jgi:hypothetical protein